MNIIDLFIKHINDVKKIEIYFDLISNIFWYGISVLSMFIGIVLFLVIIVGITLLLIFLGRKILNKIVD